MPRFDAPTASCVVLTYKEGMLSAIAHDLQLKVERFAIEIDDASEAIVATMQADSLRVDCAMKNGQEARGTLSAKNKREIEDNVARKVLDARRHPTITFRSTKVEGDGDERRIEGTLELHGVTRTVHTTARRRAGKWTAELEIHQPDHRIQPFSAMLGTLKIRPTVRVRVVVPG